MKTLDGWKGLAFLLADARRYRGGIALQFALMGVSVAFGLLKPWPLKVLVDNVAGSLPFSIGGWAPGWGWETLLVLAVLAYLVMNVGESAVQVASSTVATLTSSRMIRDLRVRLLDHVQALSLRFHDSHRVGDLVHRVTYNTTAVETALQSGLMGTVKSAMTLAGMLIVMTFMNVTLTLIALAVIPFLLVAIRWYARRTHRTSLDHQNQEGQVSSTLQEILGSIRLVKAYDRHALESGRFGQECERSVDTRLKNTLVQKSFGFVTAFILAAGTALLFLVAILEVRAGKLTIGEFLVFNSYLAMLYAPLSVLSYTASSVQGALGGASRLFEILQAPVDIGEPMSPVALPGFERELRFERLSFSYLQGRPTLQDLNFTLARGETIALVGPTGSGKSTLLALMLRFYDPDNGAINVDGVDIREVSLEQLRGLFAYVPQDSLLLNESIAANIAFGRPGASDAEIREAARLAEAEEFILKTDGGYETVVGERGVRLSAGQRQRVALARAFLRNSPILLLDEPTSALDAETEARIMHNLESSRAGQTKIIVAHRLSTITHADRILVLSDGRLVEQGTHDQLADAGGPYAHLWHAQAGTYAPHTQEARP